MLEIPTADKFGPGNKAASRPSIKQTDWLNNMKNNGCVGCHQLGQLSTRTIPEMFLKEAKATTRTPGCAASSRARPART